MLPSSHRARAVAARALVGALVLGTSIVASCTLTTSFDGLQGGPPGGGAGGDGGVDARAGDGAGETPDGTTVADAAPDVASPSDATPDACPSDTTSNPKHCGACGHDCLGGTCLGSVCQPVVLATGQSQPRGIAVLGDNVYWASLANGTLMRVRVDGTGLVTMLSGLVGPTDFLLRPDGIVLLTSDGALSAVPLDGGAPRAIVPANGPTNQTGRVAEVGGLVYFSNAQAQTVMRVGLGGGAATILATGQSQPFGLAANASRVFWTTDTGGSGSLNAADPDGANPTVLAPNQAAPRTLALFGSNLYWANLTTTGAVMRATLLADGGANVTPFASAQDRPWAVVEDSSGVYWTNSGPLGGVFTCPLAGCGGAPRTVVSGLVTPSYLTTDSRAIFVTTNGGAILKIAK